MIYNWPSSKFQFRMNTKISITDIKTEILVKQNWNWNTCLIEIELETVIHCKTIIETELKYITNNRIEIETKIYLITDTTPGTICIVFVCGWNLMYYILFYVFIFIFIVCWLMCRNKSYYNIRFYIALVLLVPPAAIGRAGLASPWEPVLPAKTHTSALLVCPK